MIENVVVRSSAWRKSDVSTLFECEDVHFTDATDLPSLLVELGVYDSKSKARQAGRCGDIPKGFTLEFKASKKRRLWIWNPTE